MAFDLAVTNFRQVKVGVSHQKIIVTCCHVALECINSQGLYTVVSRMTVSSIRGTILEG